MLSALLSAMLLGELPGILLGGLSATLRGRLSAMLLGLRGATSALSLGTDDELLASETASSTSKDFGTHGAGAPQLLHRCRSALLYSPQLTHSHFSVAWEVVLSFEARRSSLRRRTAAWMYSCEELRTKAMSSSALRLASASASRAFASAALHSASCRSSSAFRSASKRCSSAFCRSSSAFRCTSARLSSNFLRRSSLAACRAALALMISSSSPDHS
mmetsp:Transcript_19077/g.42098  ORF Transcript_19077/g.42098 Transcript_19077/m.42098 type:complete len:217 (-) Transcript_19077:1243-1893(-)